MPTYALLCAPTCLTARLRRTENAPLPLVVNYKFYASVLHLMPDYYRCSVARPVSCYALFKGMAASKPTSWLSKQLNLLSST